MASKGDNEKYRNIVIIGTIVFLVWISNQLYDKVSNISSFIGWIVGLVLIYLIYIIIKGIWPDFW